MWLSTQHKVNASADMVCYAVMHGLRPELSTYVMQQNSATYDALVEAAKVAEATVIDAGPSATSEKSTVC